MGIIRRITPTIKNALFIYYTDGEMEEHRHEINNFADYNTAVSYFQKIIISTQGIPKELILKEVKRERNYQFHKKIFGLVKFAYENTELPHTVYKDQEITQSKKTFRNELIIASGFYSIDVTGKGEVRAIADSLAYNKCSQTKAEKIFNSMLDVVASKLHSSGYDRETLERLSADWLSFT